MSLMGFSLFTVFSLPCSLCPALRYTLNFTHSPIYLFTCHRLPARPPLRPPSAPLNLTQRVGFYIKGDNQEVFGHALQRCFLTAFASLTMRLGLPVLCCAPLGSLFCIAPGRLRISRGKCKRVCGAFTMLPELGIASVRLDFFFGGGTKSSRKFKRCLSPHH